jgi:hypothetical protein
VIATSTSSTTPPAQRLSRQRFGCYGTEKCWQQPEAGGSFGYCGAIQKPAGQTLSCGWPDLNVETEVTDASGKLGRGSGWVTAGEVIGTEILVVGAVGEHVVGGG